MGDQMSLLPPDEMQQCVDECRKYANKKRRWENAFQKWSDEHGLEPNNTTSYGCCGYGAMCDWCKDNSYGRPCVRALGAMCREKNIHIDFEDYDFTKVWYGKE